MGRREWILITTIKSIARAKLGCSLKTVVADQMTPNTMSTQTEVNREMRGLSIIKRIDHQIDRLELYVEEGAYNYGKTKEYLEHRIDKLMHRKINIINRVMNHIYK